MLRNPGTGLNASEPSSGAQLTSLIEIASRRFSASESRPLTSMTPTRRHSSVRPSKAMPVSPAGCGTGAGVGAASTSWAAAALSSCLRKPNGTLVLLRRAALVANHVDHSSIRQGGRIAEDAILGDVAQEPAHDLARARLGQIRREHQELRASDRADDVGDVLAQLDGQRIVRLDSGAQDDEGEDCLATDLVSLAHDRRFGHAGMIDQGRLDLDRADPMAGDVHHVIDPAEQPE